MPKSWRDVLKASAGKPSNPFELKFNKQKFEVLNKARPGVAVGKPGASRAKAEGVRHQTLLKEYKALGKTSKLVDRRFGRGIEDDDEAALSRFALTRSRKERLRSKYQLSDDEDDGQGDDDLTHKGHALTAKNMNDFIDADDDVAVPEGMLEDQFGNFGEPAKSKAEAMSELISKSKFYKYERQRIKEENASLCGDVDASFDVIRRGLLREENRRLGGRDDQPDTTNTTDFDNAVRQLVFEKRTVAQSDAQKTPEELEKAQLEKEYKRQQEARARMIGTADEADESSEGVQLSRKMAAAEAELAAIVESLCQSSNMEEIEGLYSKVIDGLSGSSHRQILLARVCRDRLAKVFKGFTKRVLTGPAVLGKPGPIVLLQLVGRIFSTSDFHHIVATPAHLCAVYLLDYSRVTRPRHAAYSLWICDILLHYQSASRRYIPEVMNVLYSLLVAVTGRPCAEDCYYLVKPVRCDFGVGHLEYNVSNLLASPDAISKESFVAKLEEVVLQASSTYHHLEAFPELFGPFVGLLGDESASRLSAKVEQATAERSPLLLQDHKPIPLPQLEPFIEEEHLANRYKRARRDEDPERKAQQLRTAYRKELRSAQKELRKDSKFLAREQLAVRKSKDAEYRSRTNKLYGSLANEGASGPK